MSEQEKEVGRKNGKTKKQRPKSMPVPTLALADEHENSDDKPAVVSGGKKKKGRDQKQVVEGATTPTAPAEDSKKSKAKQQQGASARTKDHDIQEATTLTETQPEPKKAKLKKTKEKKGAAMNDMTSMESPMDRKIKNTTKAKPRSAPSEQTSDAPPSVSLSPPPEEEIQVPKQVTVGVIKKKKQKTRPFLEVSESPSSKVYQSDPLQEDGEEDPDAEERELLHDMATLQLMVGEEAAKSNDKKAKKKTQGKGHEIPNTTEAPAEATKVAKKSKQSKSKDKSVAEPEPVPPQTQVTKESKDEKQSKKAKKTKAKGKVEPEPEPEIQLSPPPDTVAESEKKQSKKAKKKKSGGKSESEHEPEGQKAETAAPEVEKKQPKKKAKGKGKDESEPEPQASPPEAAPEPDKKQPKKTKKTKSKEKSEPEPKPEAQPPPQEAAVAEPDKKQPEKVKKAKSKGKVAPEPEAEKQSQSPPPEEPESGKKRSLKKMKEAKSKGKTDSTDAPKAAAVENNLEESETPKKKKKKISKASAGTPDSPSIHNSGSSSTHSSKSQLATKSSKSKIASEASDDLVWVGAEKLSKKSELEFKSKDDSAVDEELMDMNLSSSSRSTSYHELSKEDRKIFQDELRKASSQHSVDAADDVEGNIKVEIDPNVKVTKSGVVKGGKGSRRPSLQVFEGGGIEQTDSASPSEGTMFTLTSAICISKCVHVMIFCVSFLIHAADKESSKKISMDLSAIPQTNPSLGLAHGHDKLDLVHRSSMKRRPMSQLLTNDQEVWYA